MLIETAESEEQADALRAEKHAHLIEADRAYKARRFDQWLASTSRASDPDWGVPSAHPAASWDAVEFISSDMAAVLPTPKLSVGKAFYLRKLNTYCYGIYSGQADTHTLAFWSEKEAKKGSNEVISALHHHQLTRNTSATHLIAWGDNTSSQLKNQFVMLYRAELAHPGGLALYERVDSKFGPPGHTFLDNDRAFGQLRQRANKVQTLGSTKAWLKLAQRARVTPRFNATLLPQALFRDWKSYLRMLYETPAKRWTTLAGETVRFLKIRSPHLTRAITPCAISSPCPLPTLTAPHAQVVQFRRGRGRARPTGAPPRPSVVPLRARPCGAVVGHPAHAPPRGAREHRRR